MEFTVLLKQEMKSINNYVILLIVSILFWSCGNKKQAKIRDTPVSGFVKICADETLAPIVDAELEVFLALYLESHIQPIYVAENQVLKRLVADSVQSVILPRTLTAEEKTFFTQQNLIPKETKFAIDALAFMVHPENADSVLTTEQMKDIFSGKINRWKLLNAKNPLDTIRIVFDNPNSSTARYVKEQFNAQKELPVNCYAVNTNEEVIKYVETHKNAIGVMGVNWISDTDEKQVQKFRKRIKVVAISPAKGEKGFGSAYQPYQSYIADESYPYRREIYFITKEPYNGLGTGFGAFLASHRGQKIIQKSGLLPATMPVRIIEIK